MTNQELEVANLSDEERRLLDEYREAGHPPLSPTTANSLFELFLAGKSYFEIQKLNPNFKIGSIVDASVRYRWVEARNRYIINLQNNSMQRLMQTQMESVNFLSLAFSAAHKKFGNALSKYLQTGDESDLEGFSLGNIHNYEKAIKALMAITGQDKKVKVEGSITQNHTGTVTNLSEKPITPDMAEKLLEIFSKEEKK